MRKITRLLRRGTTALLLLLLAGCGSAAPATLPTSAATAEVAAGATQQSDSVDPLPPTFTRTPLPTLSATPGPSPTPSTTPTATRTPTQTPTPTITPTSRPQSNPGLAIWTPLAPEGATPTSTPPTPVPTAVPTFEAEDDITNVMLLGGDDPNMGNGSQRTDAIIVVSINRDTQTASMISIPRDLYVYIPGWTMNRINTAMARGQLSGYPGGGVGLLEDTILYNFGIPIHYYAKVDFSGFQQIVDGLDGVEVAVGCELTDWRLKSPELDQNVEENWERFTLPAGIHTMDGDLALWYVRSRQSSSDWDRGRRQQQVLQAILNQGVDLNLISEVPTFFNAYRETVETDLDIGRILQLATLAPAVRANGIQHLYLARSTVSWTIPGSGAQVLLPVWDGENMMRDTFRRLYLPPALTRASREPITVEVINASGNEALALLAAENLAYYGFAPVLANEERPVQTDSTLTYFAANFKGSYDWLISFAAQVYRNAIVLDPDTVATTDYRLVVGSDYDSCLNDLFAPQPFLPEEEATPTP